MTNQKDEYCLKIMWWSKFLVTVSQISDFNGIVTSIENYRPERKDWKLDLRVNEQTELEIFAVANPPKRVNRPEACGLRHLAFCVDSVEQTVNELAEVGIECEPIRIDDYTGKKMTFFHDPDGLPLELHE